MGRSRQIIKFKVRNIIERNENFVWILGIAAAFGAIISGLKDIISSLWKLLTFALKL